MARKLLILLVIVGAGVAAWWYLSRDSEESWRRYGLPSIRVDKGTLSEAGQEKLADINKRAIALKNATTKQRFEQGMGIGDDLRKIGAYRSAADWYLKTIEWYEELPAGQRATPMYRSTDTVPFVCTWYGSVCLVFLGENEEALSVMERFLRQYPRHPARQSLQEFYELAKKDPADYAEAASILRAYPGYLK
jgi:tetratricopeptide (TPR) repeat protein